jgi:CRP/FNR family transcriptional regulator, anaerobic regulatory protein
MSSLSHPNFNHHLVVLQPVIATQPAAEFEKTLAQAPLCRVEAKEFLFAEGDTSTHLYRIETGALALHKILADGHRQVVGFAYPGDLIGLGNQGEHLMNAQAIKTTRLRCLPLSTLHQSVAKDPPLGFRLYEALGWELATGRDLMLTTGQRSATERVIGFLLAFSRRNDRKGEDPTRFELPMTRGDISDFLGLTIQTVSGTFSKLKMLGLIELPPSNRVRLADIHELAKLKDGEEWRFQSCPTTRPAEWRKSCRSARNRR